MKTSIKTLISATVLAASTGSVWAQGTAAGTDINNTASISYSVGGTVQTAIASSPTGNSTAGTPGTATTFKVDKKIDLLVTSGSAVTVVPGTNTQAITFVLENQGNSTESFSFAGTQVTGDNFDTSNCSTPSNVSLAADATSTITVNCDIPASNGGTVQNGSTSQVDLKATAVGVTETAGAEDPAVVDVVFADDTGTATDGAARNASHSAVNTYTVGSADITVTKTSTVTEDPINGVASPTVFPKRIPGATIEYTVTVANDASASTATGIVISDTLQADLIFVSAVVTGVTGATASESSSVVTTSGFNLLAGETATLTITATINNI